MAAAAAATTTPVYLFIFFGVRASACAYLYSSLHTLVASALLLATTAKRSNASSYGFTGQHEEMSGEGNQGDSRIVVM